TLAAIVRVESGGNPWRIGINGDYVLPRQPVNQAEAISKANWLINMGYNIDMGLMQVNIKNLNALKLSVEQVFDPCTNIKAGAQILQDFYQKSVNEMSQGQQSLRRAISAYNTGNFINGFANGYVAKVTQEQVVRPAAYGLASTFAASSVVAWDEKN
ncbi:MAG: lytic transglycosylase domain-containing protein, partial [Halothiobacillaceae bacterium]|nr:lytic transglycosylase domain-containing protein [Halothiobacillaceae bacterium]